MVVLLKVESFTGLAVPGVGLLIGLKLPVAVDDHSHVVLGHCCCSVTGQELPVLSSHGLATPRWVESWDKVRGCFPGGCGVCGVWLRMESGTEDMNMIISELLGKTDLQDLMTKEKKPIVLVVQSDHLAVYEVGELGSMVEVEYAPVEDYISTNTSILRVSSSLPALVNGDVSISHLLKNLPNKSPIFCLPSFSLLLPHPSHTVHPPHSTLRHFFSSSQEQKERFVPVELLHDSEETDHPLTLTISDNTSNSLVEVSIPIDSLAIVHLDLSLEDIGIALWEGIQQQLQAVVSAMIWMTETLHNVAIHHFPSSLHLCPLSIPYPHSTVTHPDTILSDSDLLGLRKDWHTALGLPIDLPQLRLTNYHFFSPPRCHGPQLLCPHSSITSSSHGTVAMVKGQYTYYHYMQDNFNDTGWGCAYRSLQTLWSWFYLQGFTTETPPTHQKIQEALVATGDKNSGFVGSKEWIGSFEVSTVLNHLLEVESRIHYVSSGAEMSGVGRVLLHHFTNEGTPIMIGGGVLAHTILGIDYNTSTGSIKFLILDPHYTGREEIKTIVNKGWCGWKTVSFWDKKAHYNMCLPLRPREV